MTNTNTTNLYERAVIERWRFYIPSGKPSGAMTVEDLERSGFRKEVVNDIYLGISSELNELKKTGIGLMGDAANVKKIEKLEAQLQLLKYIFEKKKAAEDAAVESVRTQQTLDMLLEESERRKGEGIKALSTEELEARIAAARATIAGK